MKKILALLLAMFMLCSLVACSGEDGDKISGDGINTNISEKSFSNNDIGKFTYDIGTDGHYMITGYSSTSTKEHEVTIPSTIEDVDVTGIADEAFKSFTTITNVVIPDSITYIGDLAFYGCDKLTKVTLPDSVVNIGVGAFRDCANLKEIVLSKNLVAVSDQLFWNCTKLDTVTFGTELTAIGEGAFWNCDALTAVTVPEKVTEIKATAFYGCDALAAINVPASVKTIGDAAFSNIGADKVVISGKAGSAIETYFNATYAINEKDYAHYEFKAN